MRRLALILVSLAGLSAGLLATLGGRAQGSDQARFDVIFDDARGLIGGQLVKVAGATAGEITNVTVTSDFKAKIEGTIDSRFMPLHKDATCTIRPEGLIAENYVDCDPGTLGSPPLQSRNGQPPTIPVTQTTEPVSLLDLFNIFNLPTRQRFTAIIDELGIGTAGRGADFNDILRRANPTLAEARRVIGILDGQQAQLAQAVDATSTIATQAAGHTASLQEFLDQAAKLTTLTADHSGNLSQAIARLPKLLDVAEPSLSELDTVAKEGTPLVEQLHKAVPSLLQVQHDLGPFAATAGPALIDLRAALKQAVPAIKAATPLVKTLNSYTASSKSSTQLFAKLAENLQQTGFPEWFFSVVYYVASSLSRYDTTSHMLSILLVGPQNGMCGNFATAPVAGCSAHYAPQAAKDVSGTAASVSHHTATTARSPATAEPTHSGAPASSPASSGGPGSSSSPAPSAASAPTKAGGAQKAVGQATQTLQNLVGYLLK